MSNSLGPHGLYSSWNSPGQNSGVGSLSLLQRIFPTQGSNPGLPQGSLPAAPQGKPREQPYHRLFSLSSDKRHLDDLYFFAIKTRLPWTSVSPRPFSVCLVVSESLSLFAFLICSASPISLFLLDVSLLCVPVNEDVCECSHIYTFMLSALVVGLY